MASAATTAPLSSYSNALVLLPPRAYAERINPFRMVHDKVCNSFILFDGPLMSTSQAGARWTAHITMVFPFVADEHLSAAVANLKAALATTTPFSLSLNKVDRFRQSAVDTIHLAPSDPSRVTALWSILAKTVGYTGRPFAPHLTVGQAARKSPEACQWLQSKAEAIRDSLDGLEWSVGSVAILKKDEQDGGIMKLYDEVFLSECTQSSYQVPPPTPTAYFTGTHWSTLNVPEPDMADSGVSIATYNILNDPAFPISSRLDSIRDAIVFSQSDVICLQEVSDDILFQLLRLHPISSAYSFSSRSPGIVMENERNIVVLSKRQFNWSKLDIGGKHKPAVLATFPSTDAKKKPLILAAVHLTAGRTASTLEQKTSELQALVTHIKSDEDKSDWIIAGDLNWPSASPGTPADELFNDIAPEGLATFDPVVNPLAAQTVRGEKCPQRYDRIYVMKNGAHEAVDVRLFGKNASADPGSDHWGVVARFERKEASRESVPILSHTTIASANHHLPSTHLTSQDLLDFCTQVGAIPSDVLEEKYRLALAKIRMLFGASSATPQLSTGAEPTSPSSGPTPSASVKIHVEAVGSYALGVHTSTSDLDCLAIGNISAKTFWAVAQARIKSQARRVDTNDASPESEVKLRRFVRKANVPMMQLEVYGIKVDLQYCFASGLAERSVNGCPLKS